MGGSGKGWAHQVGPAGQAGGGGEQEGDAAVPRIDVALAAAVARARPHEPVQLCAAQPRARLALLFVPPTPL